MPFDKNNPKTRRRRKVCQFCVDKATYIDYKDTAKLRRFLSERSKILPRRTTGTCAMFVLRQPRFLSVGSGFRGMRMPHSVRKQYFCSIPPGRESLS